jgi:hypothetical protein
MNPALLLPAALAALAALAIPLVIHIARRTESRTIDFAALRWLDALAKPRRRPRIDERWLLAVRLLLLAVMALWLARPVLWGVEDDRPVVAIAPGVDATTVATASGTERRIWLAPSFPAVGGDAPMPPSNLVSLIRQLDAELAPETPLTLIVPETLDGVDAERPRLSRRVAWRVAGASASTARPEPVPPPYLTVRYAAEAAEGVRYFRAAATAWAEPGVSPAFDAATTDRPINRDAEHLVWLAPGPLPAPVAAWIRNGGAALLSVDAQPALDGETTPAWRSATGEPLAMSGRVGKGRVVQLTRALEPAVLPQLVEPDFPDALARMLAPPPAPARVLAADHAPLSGAAPYPRPPYDLRPWLALLIALIFGVERWMATRRSRAPAP